MLVNHPNHSAVLPLRLCASLGCKFGLAGEFHERDLPKRSVRRSSAQDWSPTCSVVLMQAVFPRIDFRPRRCLCGNDLQRLTRSHSCLTNAMPCGRRCVDGELTISNLYQRRHTSSSPRYVSVAFTPMLSSSPSSCRSSSCSLHSCSRRRCEGLQDLFPLPARNPPHHQINFLQHSVLILGVPTALADGYPDRARP